MPVVGKSNNKTLYVNEPFSSHHSIHPTSLFIRISFLSWKKNMLEGGE